ncbi:MAG: hypothetical protein ACOC7S_01725 [Planctomycetota bacterium]
MIKLSAGLSKKVPMPDVDYSSRSCSAGAEVELANGASPEDLKERLRALYRTLEEAVDQQLEGSGSNRRELSPATRRRLSDQAKANNNGRGSHNGRPATEAQVRAIFAIAADRGLSDRRLADLLDRRCGVEDPSELSLKAASGIIDYLKNGKDGQDARR